MHEYENLRRIVYSDDVCGDATFIPVCPKCGRFVKPDDVIRVSESKGLIDKVNATCRKCGRIEMPFEGFM